MSGPQFDPETFWKSDRLKVFVSIPHDRTDNYQAVVRYMIPFTALYREGLIEKPVVGTFDEISANPWCLKLLREADILYDRCAGDGRMTRLLMECQSMGKKMIVDLDDDFWMVDPLNPTYEQTGTDEVWAENSKGEKVKLWEDGRDNFDIARNRRHVDMVAFAVGKADLVTCTTERLAGRLRRWNENIAVIPNPIDTPIWKGVLPHEGFNVGWIGGDSHARDVGMVIGPLTEFLRRHEDAHVQICLLYTSPSPRDA